LLTQSKVCSCRKPGTAFKCTVSMTHRLMTAGEFWKITARGTQIRSPYSRAPRTKGRERNYSYITSRRTEAAFGAFLPVTTTGLAKVAEPAAFHRSLCGKLDHYRKSALYHMEALDVIGRIFSSLEGNALTNLNVAGLKAVCEYLNISFDYRFCSGLSLDFPDRMGPGDWAPFISRKLEATRYVNPAGGCDLFKPSDLSDHDIDLRCARFGEFSYGTPGYNFKAGLSILDVLMWNDPNAIRQAIFDLNVLLPPEYFRSVTA